MNLDKSLEKNRLISLIEFAQQSARLGRNPPQRLPDIISSPFTSTNSVAFPVFSSMFSSITVKTRSG